MVERLDKINRELMAWNMKAIHFKSSDLNIACDNLDKVITLMKEQERQGIINADKVSIKKYLYVSLTSLDRFILKDVRQYLQIMDDCGVDGNIIFTNYLFRDQIRYIYDIAKEIYNIEYQPGIFKLEEQFCSELPY